MALYALFLDKNMSSEAFLLSKLHKFLFKVVRHGIFHKMAPKNCAIRKAQKQDNSENYALLILLFWLENGYTDNI